MSDFDLSDQGAEEPEVMGWSFMEIDNHMTIWQGAAVTVLFTEMLRLH